MLRSGYKSKYKLTAKGQIKEILNMKVSYEVNQSVREICQGKIQKVKCRSIDAAQCGFTFLKIRND